MDTHGHEECAREAGEPLLQAALARCGRRGWRTKAFYLGNWITDVQQIVDPIAAEGGQRQLIGVVDRLVEALQRLESDGWQGWLVRGAAQFMTQRRQDLNRAFTWALNGRRNSPLFTTIKAGFRVTGYFKFVHPEQRGGRAKMDYEAYKLVLQRSYRQYYPHEHLDRWPLAPQNSPSFTRVVGTVTPDGRGTGSSSLDPHLYRYLRDHVQIAAGLIAKVDRDWARLTFGPCGPWSGDTDPEWNYQLSQLGHGLHACEDFFAHSNFVELAIQGQPETQRRALTPHGHEPLAGLTGREIFERRLRRFSGIEASPDGGAESWVVTGYFDFIDTFFSMRHAYEEIFGSSDHEAPDVLGLGSKVGRFMLTTIKDIRRQAGERPLSQTQAREAAVRALQLAATSGNDPDVREAAEALLRLVPGEVRDAFLDAVAGFSQTIPGTHLAVLDLLEFIMVVADGSKYPLKLLEWLVRDLAPDAANWVVGQLRQPIDRAIRNILDAYVGRNRIGCHSLIGKDYSGDDVGLNQLYNQAKNCAKAVHWYIVKTLTRWADPTPLAVCRAETGATPASGQTNSTDLRRCIDWLELVETFLRHPHQAVRRNSSFWWEGILNQPDNGWQRFPGFSAEVGRRPGLPHTLVPLETRVRDQQVTDSVSMRTRGENAYDSSA